MDGFDFLEGLVALGQAHLIHKVVVVLTSSAHPKDQQRLNALGVKSTLLKPLSEEKVMALVAKGS